MLSCSVIALGALAPGSGGLSARPYAGTGSQGTGVPAARMRALVGTTVRTAPVTPAPAAGVVAEHRTTDQFDIPLGVLSSRRPLS